MPGATLKVDPWSTQLPIRRAGSFRALEGFRRSRPSGRNRQTTSSARSAAAVPDPSCVISPRTGNFRPTAADVLNRQIPPEKVRMSGKSLVTESCVAEGRAEAVRAETAMIFAAAQSDDHELQLHNEPVSGEPRASTAIAAGQDTSTELWAALYRGRRPATRQLHERKQKQSQNLDRFTAPGLGPLSTVRLPTREADGIWHWREQIPAAENPARKAPPWRQACKRQRRRYRAVMLHAWRPNPERHACWARPWRRLSNDATQRSSEKNAWPAAHAASPRRTRSR